MNNFNHQKTLGIIGANIDSHQFILEANKLGFKTLLLCETEEEAALIYGADKIIVGDLKDETIKNELLMESDLLVYYDETIHAGSIEDIQKTVIIPQGDDLLSIVQDQVLQKTFLDSLSINIAPYAIIVKAEDIKQEIRSIGYPAVLRTNQMNHEGNIHSYFIYDEEDIEKASKLLRYGTCVLESWIISESELSVTVVKMGNGELKLYPIIHKEYRNERLNYIQVPYELDEELSEEIKRVVHVILDNIDFRGVVTIDFFVTPAKALYVGSIYPYPNILSRYSEQACNISATVAHLRAITLLPIPEELYVENNTHIFVPFYQDQTNNINELFTIQSNWEFIFYPITKKEGMITEDALGHIIIETDNPEKVLNYLKKNGL